jgi:two-component system cell cycle response regulator
VRGPDPEGGSGAGGVKVLVAEDEPLTRRLLEASVQKLGLEVVTAGDGQEAWRILQGEDPPRLAILDWLMPGRQGVDICRDLRRRQEPYVYVLLLTGKDRKEDVVEGLNAGADDFLTKPFDVQELEARLRAGRRILELQAAIVAAREELRVRATHDPLTGVWNRAALIDFLDREVNRAARERKCLALLIADIDHFKPINDTYGHVLGDEVLCETVKRIRASIRHYDGLGRYGGEEFVIVLPGCDLEQGVRLAERIRESVGSHPLRTSTLEVPLTLSLGVTAVEPGDPHEPLSLIELADGALYRAKRAGRNRVESTRPHEAGASDRPGSHASAASTNLAQKVG